MIDKQPENQLCPSFFYGWYIVFIGVISLFFSIPNQTYSNAIFIDFYILNFNWDRSLVSELYSAGWIAAVSSRKLNRQIWRKAHVTYRQCSSRL
jgi:hypothetical protein